jgi:hypothetical protein
MRRGLLFVVAVVLSMLQLAADCVDGVTPDCSDAAARCGPNLDGSIEGSVVPEASTDAAGSDAADAGPDGDAATDG